MHQVHVTVFVYAESSDIPSIMKFPISLSIWVWNKFQTKCGMLNITHDNQVKSIEMDFANIMVVLGNMLQYNLHINNNPHRGLQGITTSV